ncbi:MAG: hypothetical protein NT004_06060 [Bacteroidetes bacterium]|nr:hypothetical protein [Bacteroidota bacterium]
MSPKTLAQTIHAPRQSVSNCTDVHTTATNKPLIPGRFRNDFLMQVFAIQAIATKKANLRLTTNEITILSALYLTNSITCDPFHNIKELQQLFAPWQPSYIHKKLKKLVSLGLIGKFGSFEKRRARQA